MGLSIESNVEEVYQRFEDLTDKELKKYIKSGLRKTMKILRDKARENLRARVNNVNRRNPKYSDTLIQGVRMTKIWENKQGANAGEIVGKVRIDAKRESKEDRAARRMKKGVAGLGSGSFRLPIIDNGSYLTGVRYQYTRSYRKAEKEGETSDAHKPKAVGRMKPTNFFQDVIQLDSIFQSQMNKAIDDGLNSVNQKL